MKIAEVQVPRTIHEALSQSDWRKAVFYEMSALEKTSTWEIVDLLKDKNTVGWEELKGWRHDSMQKDLLKLMELINRRHLPQLWNSILLESYSILLLISTSH